MSLSTSAVTVTTTAQLISVTDTDGRPGTSIAVKVPSDGQVVFVGGSDVTAANGWPIDAGSIQSFDLFSARPGTGDNTEALYAVVAAGTQAVKVIRTGV